MSINWNFDISAAPQGSRRPSRTFKGRGGTERTATEFVPDRVLVSFYDYDAAKVAVSYVLEPTKTIKPGTWSGFPPDRTPFAWAPMPAPAEVDGGSLPASRGPRQRP